MTDLQISALIVSCLLIILGALLHYRIERRAMQDRIWHECDYDAAARRDPRPPMATKRKG